MRTPRQELLKAANGAGVEERISPPDAEGTEFATDWSPDGRNLLATVITSGMGMDLRLTQVAGDHKSTPFLSTPFNESQGQFSPDGAWVAYTSDESGRQEVYVRSFSRTADKYQISANGGLQARWRRDGKELYFLTPDGKMMAVTVKAAGAMFERETPRMLFQAGWLAFSSWTLYTYDVTRDGLRFVCVRPSEGAISEPLNLLINWQAGLKR